MDDSPLKVWLERDKRLLRLRLTRPKANIIDAQMITALRSAFVENTDVNTLCGVLLDADGPHFSFGASVQEHLPESCAEMLRGLHELVGIMLEFPVPILAAVQGQCLGGGLEVACAAGPLFASSTAKFGQPEIQLGVFAPAASCLLPGRIGRASAEDLLLSGRSVGADEALAMGLVKQVDEDPEQAALTYFDTYLAPRSASSLRYAIRAARLGAVEPIKEKMAASESLYLDGLMATADAVGGLHAFLEKRPMKWEDR